MELEHSFTVPVGIDDAWKVLLDIERVATCMPGAALDTIDGDDFTGTVKVKIGPISLTYKGKASYLEKDEAGHRLVINAQGRDTRGNGTAAAKVTAGLAEDGDSSTKVDVRTDLDITGKPAQFGRGVMVDVGNKLIGQFADCLASTLSGEAASDSAGDAAPSADPVPANDAGTAAGPPAGEPAEAEGAAGSAPSEQAAGMAPAAEGAASTEPAPAPAPTRSAPRSVGRADDVQPIDLIASAGPAVIKRLVPVLAVILLILVILRRRRH
jgi:carbon monoxide dehydrogenase subunit G